MRKNGVLWLLVILLVMGFIGCGDEDNDPEIYTVTIGTFENGSITANPNRGIAGTEIILTVTPENIYRLKNGSLKYGTTAINEVTLKFIMPYENIIITADFESSIIGSWGNYEGYINFFNDGIYGIGAQGVYYIKGIWTPIGINKLLLTEKYFSNGIVNLDDFTYEHNIDESLAYTIEIKSNKTIEVIDGNGLEIGFIFPFVE